jgi:hypothetical protein
VARKWILKVISNKYGISDRKEMFEEAEANAGAELRDGHEGRNMLIDRTMFDDKIAIDMLNDALSMCVDNPGLVASVKRFVLDNPISSVAGMTDVAFGSGALMRRTHAAFIGASASVWRQVMAAGGKWFVDTFQGCDSIDAAVPKVISMICEAVWTTVPSGVFAFVEKVAAALPSESGALEALSKLEGCSPNCIGVSSIWASMEELEACGTIRAVHTVALIEDFKNVVDETATMISCEGVTEEITKMMKQVGDALGKLKGTDLFIEDLAAADLMNGQLGKSVWIQCWCKVISEFMSLTKDGQGFRKKTSAEWTRIENTLKRDSGIALAI